MTTHSYHARDWEVRAFLENRKTLLVLPLKPQPPATCRVMHRWPNYDCWTPTKDMQKSLLTKRGATARAKHPNSYYRPPYTPGDIVVVRETWGVDCGLGLPDSECIAARHNHCLAYRATDETTENAKSWRGHWRSPATMPRDFSRLSRVVREVGCKRVLDFTEDEIRATGANTLCGAKLLPAAPPQAYRAAFSTLWNDKHPQHPYEGDPHVWWARVEEVDGKEGE